MNLYELSQQYQEVLELIESGEDYADTLESIEDAIEYKLESIAKIMRQIEAQADVIKSERERLYQREKALRNERERLKTYAEDVLDMNGMTKVKGDLFTVSIQNNPPSANIIDASKIPGQYLIQQEPKIDTKGILQALKEGQEVPGAEKKQGKSLRIR